MVVVALGFKMDTIRVIVGSIRVVVIVVACVGGLVLGISMPMRWFADARGFEPGVWIGILFVLGMGFLCGQLVGGWGEALLGTEFGVPIGIFIGCALGTFVATIACGLIGRLVASIFD